MAERRMFARNVTNDDHFMNLSASAQAFYLHLCMNADDDGFCNQVSIQMFRAHASVQDLEALLKEAFLYQFDTGVVVIRHWRQANAIRKDRYARTMFQDELAMLSLDANNVYVLTGAVRQNCSSQPDRCLPEMAVQVEARQTGDRKTAYISRAADEDTAADCQAADEDTAADCQVVDEDTAAGCRADAGRMADGCQTADEAAAAGCRVVAVVTQSGTGVAAGRLPDGCQVVAGWLPQDRSGKDRRVKDRVCKGKETATATATTTATATATTTATATAAPEPELPDTKPKTGRRFRKPTVAEIRAYEESLGFPDQAERFHDYYESCGWTVGRNRSMKDWKSARRNWARRDAEQAAPKTEYRTESGLDWQGFDE